MAQHLTMPGLVRPGSLIRPKSEADHFATSAARRIGLVVGGAGLMVAMAAFIGSLVTAALVADGDNQRSVLANSAWTFGVSTAALATLKIGIALVLLGILRRLWTRVESVKAGLAKLVPSTPGKAEIERSRIATPYGIATHTPKAPRPLGIHRMAYAMWAPMLIMGVMVTAAGLVLSIAEAANASDTADYLTLGALAQGTEFLGEALILSGISFVLGSILGSLRQGGSEVQESVGAGVKTLAMPALAKGFLGLMMIGLMLGMVQFALYVYVATLSNEATITAFFAWLGPLREVSLGLILSGIVLALATIGTKVLPFQFWRIQELIRNGR